MAYIITKILKDKLEIFKKISLILRYYKILIIKVVQYLTNVPYIILIYLNKTLLKFY